MSTGPPPYSSSAMDIGAGGLHTLNAALTRSHVAITQDATPLLGPPGALPPSHPLVNPFATNFSGSPLRSSVPLPFSISNSNFHRPSTVNSDHPVRPTYSHMPRPPLSLPGNGTLDNMPTPRFDNSLLHYISYASTPRLDVEGVQALRTPGSRPFTVQPSLVAVPSPFNRPHGFGERSATAFEDLPPAIASSRVLPYPLYRPTVNDLNYPPNTREFLIPHSATPGPFISAPMIQPILRDVRSTPIIHQPQPQLTTPLILQNDPHPLIDFNHSQPQISPPATATYIHSNSSPLYSHHSWQSHPGPDQPLSPLRSHIPDREPVYYNSSSSVQPFIAPPLAPQVIHPSSPYVQSYVLSHPQPSPYTHEFFDETTNAYMAFPPQLDTILDSGCTNHIFRDRSLFWNYRADTSTSIRTANCGTLSALGRGDVKVRLVIAGQTVRWTLRDCLHAPGVPINLISVGQLQNASMTIAFGKDSTILSFPASLNSLSFQAVIYNRLSFVKCDFLRPIPQIPAALVSLESFPVFADAPLTPELWHRRLGHPGMESTRAMLTKPYADGITWMGIISDTHCIPCLVGKGPQAPYSHNAHRASTICELIHIDTCGPYPVQTPRKELYFFIMLDDASNYGCTSLLVKKSDAFLAWKRTTASWELISGGKVKAVRTDGAKEFVEGDMGNYLRDCGIAVQLTAPYAHSQNGKAERYIRTIADTAQTLLADAKLPMSFWGDAVRMAQYLRNRTPTKTLPGFQTPYEAMNGKRPDLSDLRVWGCECWFSIPPEIRDKGGPRREQGIFVGYDENRKGWLIRDIMGKYHFSRSVVFNELVPGHLSPRRFISRAGSTTSEDTPIIPNTRTLRSQTNSKRPLLDMVIRERDERLSTLAINLPTHHSAENVELFIAYNTTLAFFSHDDFFSTNSSDTADSLVFEHSFAGSTRPLKSFRHREYDLTRPPEDYDEAISRSDRDIWIAAMKREVVGLDERKAYSVSDLPPGRKAIGVRWVYDYKRDEFGTPIPGKEKGRLVAQGFSQRPEDFNHTYAPVPKLTSDRILLAYANHHDLEILFFDVKTAFLHAKLENTIFIRQIPGFKLLDPSLVLRLHVALYGLRQSAYEFYQLLRKLLLRIGLVRCEVDHAVFVGRWSSPPISSIPMPSDGSSLLLVVPVHVDDGLVITNSVPLYKWFIAELSKDLEIVDLGAGSMYLGMRILRDRSRRKLWISQKAATIDLLKNWDMLEVTPTQVPLTCLPDKFPPAGPNSLPGIAESDVKITFQRLVGSLLYLSICSRPDISYAALALSQFNSNPTRSHLLAAKGVLRYLASTVDYALEFPAPTESLPQSVTPHIHACALSDADWASDSSDRKSISGYAFYFYGSLVSWSSTKQKSIAASSTESEYYALSHATREALWIRLFMTINGFPIPRPFPFLGDNQSTITIANDPSHVNSKRTKHIDVRYHFFREQITDGTLITVWVPTTDMIADIFTKPLLSTSFSKHRASLGLLPH